MLPVLTIPIWATLSVATAALALLGMKTFFIILKCTKSRITNTGQSDKSSIDFDNKELRNDDIQYPIYINSKGKPLKVVNNDNQTVAGESEKPTHNLHHVNAAPNFIDFVTPTSQKKNPETSDARRISFSSSNITPNNYYTDFDKMEDYLTTEVLNELENFDSNGPNVDAAPSFGASVTPSPQKDNIENICRHRENNEARKELFPSSSFTPHNFHDEFEQIEDYLYREVLHENMVSQPVGNPIPYEVGAVTLPTEANFKNQNIESVPKSRSVYCADCDLQFQPHEQWKNVCIQCYRKRMETVGKGLIQEFSSTQVVQQSKVDESEVKKALALLKPSRPGCCGDCNRQLSPYEKWKKVCSRCYRNRMDQQRARSRQEPSSSYDTSLHETEVPLKPKVAKKAVVISTSSLCIVCQNPTNKKSHDYCLPCYREQETIETSQAQKPRSKPNVVQLPPDFLQMSCKDRIRQRRVYVCIDCGTIVPETWMIQCKVCYERRPVSKSILNSAYNEKIESFQSKKRKKLR